MIDDQQMLGVYAKFQARRRKTADEFVRERILRHDNFELTTEYPLSALVFGQMASDFNRGLIGEMNRFLVHLHGADAWVHVANELESDDRLAMLWEFAEPLLELLVSVTFYAITT